MTQGFEYDHLLREEMLQLLYEHFKMGKQSLATTVLANIPQYGLGSIMPSVLIKVSFRVTELPLEDQYTVT